MIQFTRPAMLLLVIPLAYHTWRLAGHSLADMSKFRSRLALALRLIVVLLLTMAIAGARMVRNVSQQCVIFALDVSDSVPKADQQAAIRYINRSVKSMKRDQKVGLIVFGGEASVELAPGNIGKLSHIYSVPARSQTDLSQALGLAVASFPENYRKKIVLFSDGNETMGKSIEQASLAGTENVSIDVVPIGSRLPKEALLDHIICPNQAKVGEPFDLKVVAVSKRATLARIRIVRSGRPVGERVVDLPRGKSVFAFKQSIPKAGSYEYQAVLDCKDDTRPENNVASAFTMVKGKPRVLYIEGREGQGTYLKSALSGSDIDVELRNRSGIPNTLPQLRAYDMLVLSDVPAWNMAPDQMEMIRSAVRDLGMGFVMVGGENSFGAGGYFDTPIEKALPVDMSVRKTKVLPSLSVVIVMDKSGSMSMPQNGRQKIQLANDAAAAVVKLLQPIDKVGVIVCHDFPVTAVRLQPANNKGPIYREISTIRAEGGGITVFQSMEAAYKMIAGSATRQKHVILLADGSDCDNPNGTVELAQKMAREKMTVTTVAFGTGKDVNFLKAVAYAGKGDFYLCEQGRDLKAIFTKDVMTVSKSLVIEEPFVPRMDPDSPELSGIDLSSVPPLLGYVTTSPKPTAAVSAVSPKKDPILATWQYGLGRSAAFTSDCKARWSARWLTWPGYNKIWAQVVRSTMRKSSPSNYQATIDASGGRGRLAVDAVDEKGNFINQLEFRGSVVDPDLHPHSLAIEQTGPGRYEASFDARLVGNYLVNVSRKGAGAPEANVLSIPYPPEYKDVAPDTALLKRIASATSGRFDPSPEQVFRGDFQSMKSYVDLWTLLTLIALLILPFDVAVRRVGMSPEQVVELVATARDRVRLAGAHRTERRSAQARRTEDMATLLKVRKRKEPEMPMQIHIEQPPAQNPEVHPQPPKQEQEPEEVASRLLQAKKRAKGKGDS